MKYEELVQAIETALELARGEPPTRATALTITKLEEAAFWCSQIGEYENREVQ